MEIICIETDNNSTDILKKIATTPIILSAPINKYEYELINLDSTSQVNNSTLVTTDIIVYEGDFIRKESILPNSIRYMGEIYLVNNVISAHDKDKLAQMMSWQANTEIEILDGLEYITTESSNSSIVIAFYKDPLRKEWTYPILTGITNAFTTPSSNKLLNAPILDSAERYYAIQRRRQEEATQILEQKQKKVFEKVQDKLQEILERRQKMAKEKLDEGQKEFNDMKEKIEIEKQNFDGSDEEFWDHLTAKVDDFRFVNLFGKYETLEGWKSDIEGRLKRLELMIDMVDENKDTWEGEDIESVNQKLKEMISSFQIKDMQVDEDIDFGYLQEREFEAQDISTEAALINADFATVRNLIERQGVDIDITEENIDRVKANVRQGVQSLEDAVEMQSQSTGFSWEDFMSFTRLINTLNEIYQYIRRLLSYINLFSLIF